jgi:hypothetical protein
VINPNDVKSVPVIVYERDRHIGRRDTAIIVLSLLTIILFASFYYFKNIFGDIGILSLCFVSVMFGTGMLSEVSTLTMSLPSTVAEIETLFLKEYITMCRWTLTLCRGTLYFSSVEEMF